MWRTCVSMVLATLLFSGCSSSWAPVEDRSVYQSSYKLTSDGHYRVRRGDSLHAIAFNFGLDWRDIASWNSIGSPYVIYPDQELRLTPPRRQAGKPAVPAATTAGTTSSDGAPSSRTPAEGRSTTTISPAKSPGPATSKSTPDPNTRTTAVGADPGKWLWPTNGRLVSSYQANDPARKGIDIGGKEGQAVIASAAGEVVYSGNGLIGYGELIIIKHSERMLSAYAHNRKRLVAEGQTVAAGDRIAEMGKNDRNQSILHFEIRVNGSPRDPLSFLPGR